MQFTNKTTGPKAVNAKSGQVLVEPGQTTPDLELTEAEAASAKATGWFEIKGQPAVDPKAKA